MTRLLWLLLVQCGRPAPEPVANRVGTRREQLVELDRAHPRRDCPPVIGANIFDRPVAVTLDACLRGALVGDSVAVNASMRAPNGRVASRRAIVGLDGRVLLHGTETFTHEDSTPPIVVALVDLDGDGKQEILEEDEVFPHQHVTRVYKVYEDTIIQLEQFPHALEDGRRTCVASWTIEELPRSRRALIVSARSEPPKRPSGDHDGVFECLPPGRHSFTIEDDRLVDGFAPGR